jgi:Mn2+/Fe2+ NRAMP family transporter
MSNLTFPPLSAELRSNRLLDLLKLFGPGAIIASVTIGSGETLFSSRGGAIFEYAIAWCFVFGLLMKGVQVYTSTRYITLTGEHPMAYWAFLPGPRAWFPICFGAMTLISFPFFLSSLPVMLGSLAQWVVGVGSPQVWGTFFVLLAILVTFIQSYSTLERVQTFIVGILLVGILIAAVVSNPSWLDLIQGVLVPVIPEYATWVQTSYPAIAARPSWVEVMTYLGVIGGGTQDYIGYVGMLREKGWGRLGIQNNDEGARTTATHVPIPLSEHPDDVRTGLAWLKAPFTDTVVSFTAVLIFAIAFMILGATVLHQQQLIPDGFELLSLQAQFLTQFHPLLLYVYQIGIFTAFFGTILGAYELYTRTTYECLRPISPVFRQMPLRKIRVWVVTYTGIVGLVLIWTGWNPISLITPVSILTGVFMCGIWCFVMIWTDRRFLPAPYRMGRGLMSMNVLAGTAMCLFGLKAIIDYVSGMF